MFVTFNIVTFAGLVTFNSLISTQRKQFLEMKIMEAQASVEKQAIHQAFKTTGEEQDVLPPQDVTNEHIVKVENEAPMREYTIDDINLKRKASKLITYDSQLAKMSLFHMMYAYFLMRHVTSTQTTDSSSILWDEEIKIIKRTYSIDGNFADAGNEQLMSFFYKSWKGEFSKVFDNLHKSQKFHFPDWKYYPDNMRYVCSNLYNNDMNSVDDFAQFYASIRAKDLKKLLRLWFSDNSSLIKPSLKGNMEQFYCTLIRDSYGDNFLFDRYSSILWNPTDSRRRMFFPAYSNDGVRSASIDTILNVLQGYVNLQEKKGIQHNAAIIRLISMIKKDCIMAKSSNCKGVRILLPRNETGEALAGQAKEQNFRARDRRKCHELVSQNPKVLKLLDKISKWKDPTA